MIGKQSDQPRQNRFGRLAVQLLVGDRTHQRFIGLAIQVRRQPRRADPFDQGGEAGVGGRQELFRIRIRLNLQAPLPTGWGPTSAWKIALRVLQWGLHNYRVLRRALCFVSKIAGCKAVGTSKTYHQRAEYQKFAGAAR